MSRFSVFLAFSSNYIILPFSNFSSFQTQYWIFYILIEIKIRLKLHFFLKRMDRLGFYVKYWRKKSGKSTSWNLTLNEWSPLTDEKFLIFETILRDRSINLPFACFIHNSTSFLLVFLSCWFIQQTQWIYLFSRKLDNLQNFT